MKYVNSVILKNGVVLRLHFVSGSKAYGTKYNGRLTREVGASTRYG
jgi:hypothetical protein